MERRAIIPKVRAFLGRVELELAQVAGPVEDRIEVINIYTPVLDLPAGNLEGHVILDGLYPRNGVALDFEVGSSSEVISINGHNVKSSRQNIKNYDYQCRLPFKNETSCLAIGYMWRLGREAAALTCSVA